MLAWQSLRLAQRALCALQVARFLTNLARTTILRTAFVAKVGMVGRHKNDCVVRRCLPPDA